VFLGFDVVSVLRREKMKRLNPYLWALALVGSVGAGFILQPMEQSPPRFPLEVNSSDLRLGHIWGQHHFKFDLPIKNRGVESIQLAAIDVSCRCASSTLPAARIPPDGSSSVSFVLDTTYSDGVLGEPRTFTLDLIPTLRNWPGPPPVWRLEGQVRTPVAFDPRALAVATDHTGKVQRSALVDVCSVVPFQAIEIAESDLDWQPAIDLKCSTKATISVTVPKDLAPGHYSDVLRVAVRLKDIAEDLVYNLPLSLHIPSDVSVFPERIMYGICEIGTVASTEVVFRSALRCSFRVQAVSLPDDLQIGRTGNHDEFRDHVCWRIERLVKKTGLVSTSIPVEVVHEDGRLERLELPITYVGISKENIPRTRAPVR